MFFYLEFVNIIWIVLTKLFQAVGSLLNGFVAIRCHCFAIERVHAAHVCFVKHSPIMAAELLQLIRYMIVDIAITNIARQDGASNTLTPPTIEIVGFLGGGGKAYHHAAYKAASYAVSHQQLRV